jgi:hypothetical protein
VGVRRRRAPHRRRGTLAPVSCRLPVVLLSALAFACQPAPHAGPPIVEVPPPDALPGAAPERAVTAKRPPKPRPEPAPCDFYHYTIPCDHWSGCEPSGPTTLDRECWVRVF